MEFMLVSISSPKMESASKTTLKEFISVFESNLGDVRLGNSEERLNCNLVESGTGPPFLNRSAAKHFWSAEASSSAFLSVNIQFLDNKMGKSLNRPQSLNRI